MRGVVSSMLNKPEWLVKYCEFHYRFFTRPVMDEYITFMDESFVHEGFCEGWVGVQMGGLADGCGVECRSRWREGGRGGPRGRRIWNRIPRMTARMTRA